MTPREEAVAILRLVGGDFKEALRLVESQMAVLTLRSQVLMTLAGVVVTVTGFSGRIIAGTSRVAQVSIVIGVFIVVFSAMWQFRNVMHVRWLTQMIGENPEQDLTAMIERRDSKTRAYLQGGAIFFIGALFYLVALSLMLLYPGHSNLPPR